MNNLSFYPNDYEIERTFYNHNFLVVQTQLANAFDDKHNHTHKDKDCLCLFIMCIVFV